MLLRSGYRVAYMGGGNYIARTHYAGIGMESAAYALVEVNCYRLWHKSLKLPDMPTSYPDRENIPRGLSQMLGSSVWDIDR